MWNPLKFFRRSGASDYEQRRAEILANAPIPVIWLFGKTGSGKTSIIRYLTGAQDAEIGSGFRPQTRNLQQYSFPDQETPLVNFWDTRGLGEVDYDPKLDVAHFDDAAHLIVVTVRAMDHSTEDIVNPLRAIGQANPNRPVLLVLTCLHDAYPGQQHPVPDPFATIQFQTDSEATDSEATDSEATDSEATDSEAAGSEETNRGSEHAAWGANPSGAANRTDAIDDFVRRIPRSLPDPLYRSLVAQLRRFAGLFDDFVVIDFTKEEEGFVTPDFGGDRLKHVLIRLLPQAYRQSLIQLDQMQAALGALHRQRCSPVILAHSALAASAAAVPIPWVDIPAVLAIQTHLARRLAAINNQALNRNTIAQLTGVLGGQAAVQLGLRQTLKLIPWFGSAANSASTFAVTFAAGWAWNWYFMQQKAGHVPTAAELQQQYQSHLQRGARLWETSRGEH